MGDEQDRLLPIANVGRIMKQILPPAAKVSKEFISFVTCEASDRCHKENRKTVNGDDVYWALCSLGLDNHAEATGKYLHKYREFERERALQNKASTVTQGNSEECRPTTDPSSLEITVMDRK
ncbi:hypothetical protein DCAR_0933870 [Daucus carota subsp. sativus]|uniref:Transcription factor CBF/NF-Y/archaeal histone domain-containing protein n=1 Tax=Daucus carota subsp. sativus TaxID=79200 RepID=A0AAF0XU24_DAUCS|nr:hypothetical protein DCAR_0933870 [Daucus carota subsp. sativus]